MRGAWLVLPLALAGCGVVPAQTSQAARRHVVEMKAFGFEPAQLQVQAGDTVEFVNRDAVPHTATATDQAWNTGQIEAGASGMWIVAGVGEQSYYCIFHPTMKGKLEVGKGQSKREG